MAELRKANQSLRAQEVTSLQALEGCIHSLEDHLHTVEVERDATRIYVHTIITEKLLCHRTTDSLVQAFPGDVSINLNQLEDLVTALQQEVRQEWDK